MSEPSSEGAPTQTQREPLVAMLRDPLLLAQQSLRQWDRSLRVARTANLLGRVAVALRPPELMRLVPVPVQAHLLAANRLVEHQRDSMARECRRISNALEGLRTKVVLLKGAAYAATGLRASHGRLYGDIDLMVPRQDIAQAEGALMAHGWLIGEIDPYDERYYRQWMHEIPPMTHLQRGTVVDLHHNILPMTASRVPNAAHLLADSRPVAGTSLSVLSPADMVIHSAVHLFHEGELRNGLRDLLDLDALLTQFSREDSSFWSQLLSRAVLLNQSIPLHLALRYVGLVVGTNVPTEVSAAAAKVARLGSARQAGLDAMYLRALLPDEPHGGGATLAAARVAVYVRSHALRMPLARLSYHLARKAVMRTIKHSARNTP